MSIIQQQHVVTKPIIKVFVLQIGLIAVLSTGMNGVVDAVTGHCDQDTECGFNSVCVNNTCTCGLNFTLHENKKDCIDATCGSVDCVSCVQGACQRCVHFIDKESRQCLHSCTGKAEMIYTGDLLGSVCTQSSGQSDLSDLIIGTVAGVSAGILLCVILGLCLHFHLKRKRGQVNLQHRHLHTNTMEMGKMRKIPVFDNKAFIIQPEPPLISHEAYMLEVERMKPSAQMLLDLLNQIRRRVRAMEPTDARIPTYKGVIHQLCRVLVMLNKKDPGSSVPADGLSLLEWARQMLQDYIETRQSLEDVDVEEDGRSSRYPAATTPETTSTHLTSNDQQPLNPVYASPVDSLERSRSASQSQTFAQIPGPYSSVTLPYTEKTDSQVVTNGTARFNKSTPVSSPVVPTENSGGSVESHGIRSGYKKYPVTRPVINHNPVVSHNPAGAPDSRGDNADLYAPASSSSDYAQPRFSTFSGGLARSLSTNSQSNGSSDDSDEPMPDGLPFDLEDATEPVEV